MKNLTLTRALLFFVIVTTPVFSQQQISRGQAAQTSQDADVQAQVQKLSSPSATEREQALCALGQMRKRAVSAIPVIIRLLGDATEVERIDCGGAWTNEAVMHQRTTVGMEAGAALVRIGAPDVVEPLIAVMGDQNVNARANATLALGVLRDERGVEPLISALRDTDATVRKYAALGLGHIRDSRVVEPLIAALRDADAGVRSHAALALGHAGDSRSVLPLVNALRDSDWEVRSHAALALGVRGDERAIQGLTAALQDQNEVVRHHAAMALGIIRQRSGRGRREIIREIIIDPDDGVH